MDSLQTFSGPLQERSYRFALAMIGVCRNLSESRHEFILSKQLMKAGTSIGANIEEAQQAQSRNDFISKMSIALKEAYESRYWLRLLGDSGYLTHDHLHPFIKQSEEIISMLVKTVKTAKSSV